MIFEEGLHSEISKFADLVDIILYDDYNPQKLSIKRFKTTE